MKSFLKKSAFHYLLRGFLLLVLLIIFFWAQESELPKEAEEIKLYPSKEKTKEVVGFLPFWMVNDELDLKYEQLTQIIFFGLDFDYEGNLVTDEPFYNLTTTTRFKDILKKAKENNIKVLVALKCFDSDLLAEVLWDKEKTSNLINQTTGFVKEKGLDGVNIDFEFESGSAQISPIDFSSFVKILAKKLKKDNPKALISVDFYADTQLKNYPYDLENLRQILDQTIIMAYDFHRRASEFAGPVAPLYQSTPDFNYDVARAAKFFCTKFECQKVILGIPFYGYQWQTATSEFNAETFWGSGKTVLYKDIHPLIEENNLEVFWDDVSKTNWITWYESWRIYQLYFDSQNSLHEKVKFVKSLGMGGVSIWALGYEGKSRELWQALIQLQ